MKRAVPWIRVAGFIVGLVVLVAIFDYAFAQTGYVRYVLTYFQNSDEDIDTLVLGASHARSAIDPQKIDDVNDTNSFSLAIPGEMVKDSYYVLQEACRSKKIKTLIFDVGKQTYGFHHDYRIGCFDGNDYVHELLRNADSQKLHARFYQDISLFLGYDF